MKYSCIAEYLLRSFSMFKLDSNWRFQLISDLARGKFFIEEDFALRVGYDSLELLGAGSTALATIPKRSLHLVAVSDSLSRTPLFLYDDEEETGSNRSSGNPWDSAPKGSTAIIPIKGTLLKYGTMCQYGALELAQLIRLAAAHPNINAIVLDIDSGGGAVNAVAPLTEAIRFVKTTGKPIGASIDMACSAAYWVASETDILVADNSISAMVGSIGVMLTFADMAARYEKEGIKIHTVYSKFSGQKNKEMADAMEGDYEAIQTNMLDPLAIRFRDAVKANRKGKLNLSDESILEGKTYFPEEGKSIGLIDKIGDSMAAVLAVSAMAHARKIL